MSEPLDAARAAVQQSDKNAARIGTRAMSQETADLRTALRALIQWAEQQERENARRG